MILILFSPTGNRKLVQILYRHIDCFFFIVTESLLAYITLLAFYYSISLKHFSMYNAKRTAQLALSTSSFTLHHTLPHMLGRADKAPLVLCPWAAH